MAQLRAGGVEIREIGEDMYLLKKDTAGGLREKVFRLPPLTRRRMIQELRHRYEVDLSFHVHVH